MCVGVVEGLGQRVRGDCAGCGGQGVGCGVFWGDVGVPQRGCGVCEENVRVRSLPWVRVEVVQGSRLQGDGRKFRVRS